MSPLIVGFHASHPKHREGIRRHGLLPSQRVKSQSQPFGVYVFRDDPEFDHPCRNSGTVWHHEPEKDLWQAAYFGEVVKDPFVLNAFIFLDGVTLITLITEAE